MLGADLAVSAFWGPSCHGLGSQSFGLPDLGWQLSVFGRRFWPSSCPNFGVPSAAFQGPRCQILGCLVQLWGHRSTVCCTAQPRSCCAAVPPPLTPFPPPPNFHSPPPSRTTAFGFLNAFCKLAAVLGISIFTSFVGITKAVPILLASAALALGSSLALKLPETRGQVLQ